MTITLLIIFESCLKLFPCSNTKAFDVELKVIFIKVGVYTHQAPTKMK